MKFFDEFIKGHELKLPRKTEENSDTFIDWTDYNYPSFYALIHYKPAEVKEKDKLAFIDVLSLEFVPRFDFYIHFLRRVFDNIDLCILKRLDKMGWFNCRSDSSLYGNTNCILCFLQGLLRDCDGQRILDILQIRRDFHNCCWLIH